MRGRGNLDSNLTKYKEEGKSLEFIRSRRFMYVERLKSLRHYTRRLGGKKLFLVISLFTNALNWDSLWKWENSRRCRPLTSDLFEINIKNGIVSRRWFRLFSLWHVIYIASWIFRLIITMIIINFTDDCRRRRCWLSQQFRFFSGCEIRVSSACVLLVWCGCFYRRFRLWSAESRKTIKAIIKWIYCGSQERGGCSRWWVMTS